MTMSSPDDRLWPSGVPGLRFDGPLAVGASGGHGPIRYQLTSLDEKTGMVFRFQEPTGLVGHHSFHVLPDGRAGTVLRHELVAEPEGWMRARWPLAVRWVHHTVLEELLDRAELGTGNAPAQPHQRSLWVRSLLSVGAPRLRAVPVPLSSSACQALPRVDWSDAYRMALRPDAPQEPEVWRRLLFGSVGRSRLLRLRTAAGRALRGGTGGPLGPEGLFPVLRRTPDEVLVGLDDRHLNFRATVGVSQRTDGRSELVVTTAVLFHNASGRRYLAVIKPFHRRLVPSAMRHAAHLATSLSPASAEAPEVLP
jgi:hypothetical protein